MANGTDGKFEPEWCRMFRESFSAKLDKKDSEIKAIWEELRGLDNKYDKKFTSILFLLITNLLTLATGLIILLLKVN